MDSKIIAKAQRCEDFKWVFGSVIYYNDGAVSIYAPTENEEYTVVDDSVCIYSGIDATTSDNKQPDGIFLNDIISITAKPVDEKSEYPFVECTPIVHTAEGLPFCVEVEINYEDYVEKALYPLAWLKNSLTLKGLILEEVRVLGNVNDKNTLKSELA